jgi:hypothetical protein
MNQPADKNLPREFPIPLPELTLAQMDYHRGLFEQCYLRGAHASMLTRSGYGYVHRQVDDMWLGWTMCARAHYAQTEQLREVIARTNPKPANQPENTPDGD